MNIIAHALLLIALHIIAAKKFEECEFAIELYNTHQIPREDIFKHFCIATSLHTAKDERRYKGIYSIGSQWWCGQNARGGGCNVRCSDLIDDDIADDVSCAKLILSQQGLGGWKKTETFCTRYVQKVDSCLAAIDVLTGLTENNVSGISMMTTTIVPKTTIETTIAPPTTTEKSISPPTTTEKSIVPPKTTEKSIAPSTRTTKKSIAPPTTTEKSIAQSTKAKQLTVSTTSPTPTTTTATSKIQNATNEKQNVMNFRSAPHQTFKVPFECSCAAQNFILSVMAVALLGAVAAILFKYRNLKRFVSKVSNKEYEEHLIS